MRNRIIRDIIFISATTIILLCGTSTLIQELNFGGDLRGLSTIWLLVVVVLPITLLIYIPWNIWFLIQFIKYRNNAYKNNIIPLTMIGLVFIYLSIHCYLTILRYW